MRKSEVTKKVKEKILKGELPPAKSEASKRVEAPTPDKTAKPAPHKIAETSHEWDPIPSAATKQPEPVKLCSACAHSRTHQATPTLDCSIMTSIIDGSFPPCSLAREGGPVGVAPRSLYALAEPGECNIGGRRWQAR